MLTQLLTLALTTTPTTVDLGAGESFTFHSIYDEATCGDTPDAKFVYVAPANFDIDYFTGELFEGNCIHWLVIDDVITNCTDGAHGYADRFDYIETAMAALGWDVGDLPLIGGYGSGAAVAGGMVDYCPECFAGYAPISGSPYAADGSPTQLQNALTCQLFPPVLIPACDTGAVALVKELTLGARDNPETVYPGSFLTTFSPLYELSGESYYTVWHAFMTETVAYPFQWLHPTAKVATAGKDPGTFKYADKDELLDLGDALRDANSLAIGQDIICNLGAGSANAHIANLGQFTGHVFATTGEGFVSPDDYLDLFTNASKTKELTGREAEGDWEHAVDGKLYAQLRKWALKAYRQQ